MTRNEYTPRLEGDLDAGQHQIYNLPAPVSDSEAANKAYVDAGGGGGSQAVELLGPFAITFQTAGLDNPNDNGALVGPTIPAGTLILGIWLQTTTPWAATVSVDEFDLVMNTTGAGLMSIISSVDTTLNANFYNLNIFGSQVNAIVPVWLAVADRIAVAFYSTANLTAGAGNIYALVASV